MKIDKPSVNYRSLRRIAEARRRNMSCKHDARLAARTLGAFLKRIFTLQECRRHSVLDILVALPISLVAYYICYYR